MTTEMKRSARIGLFLGRFLSVTLLTVMGASWLFLGYKLFWEDVSPITEDELHEITSETNGGGTHTLYVTRRICSKLAVSDVIHTEILGRTVHALPPVLSRLSSGCHTSNRRREIPTLPDGDYVWSTRYRFCNLISNCDDHRLTPFRLTFRNGHPSVGRDIPPELLELIELEDVVY